MSITKNQEIAIFNYKRGLPQKKGQDVVISKAEENALKEFQNISDHYNCGNLSREMCFVIRMFSVLGLLDAKFGEKVEEVKEDKTKAPKGK